MDAASAALRRLIERVESAAAGRTALEIRGGNTKSFYGNVPRGEVLTLAELRGVTSYEPSELVITALAGTPLEDVERELAAQGQCLAFEPPRFAPGGTVGGMVAAGLSGPGRVSAGPLRDYLLGASVLNSRGELLGFGGQVMKNVAGYDVTRVMAGSMGILGVIVEVSLRVMPLPPASVTVCVDADEADALRRLNRWAALPLPLNASVWYRHTLYARLSGARAAVDAARRQLGGEAMAPQGADAWWDAIRDQRHAHFQLSAREFERGLCLWRLALPDTCPPLPLPGEQLIEWGGGLRWLRTDAAADQLRAQTLASGGHATLFNAHDKSAGVFTPPSRASLGVQQRLKQAFDPQGIFNPGRLYAEI